MQPDYATPEGVERWIVHLNTAVNPATAERGLASKHQPAEPMAVVKLLQALAAEERQLAWAVATYGKEVGGLAFTAVRVRVRWAGVCRRCVRWMNKDMSECVKKLCWRQQQGRGCLQ